MENNKFNVKWICKLDGFECNTRKEMKEHIGKVSYFNKLVDNKIIYYVNYIASYELQKNNRECSE